MESVRTQVVIIGAGPAGLLLGHLLQRDGIDNVIVETRSLEYVQHRVRAGVIEYGIANFLEESGVGTRMRAEGLVHHGVEFRVDGVSHRIALSDLYDGHAITVYGQQEVVKDLIEARKASGAPLHFDATVTSIEGHLSAQPSVTYRTQHGEARITADYVIGCDGSHGVSVASVPSASLRRYERVYPFSWLGILAEAPPATEELIYCRHTQGFALYSMRSPTLSRLYLGVPPDEKLDDWSDDRIWDELTTRLATERTETISRGPIIERGITPMRSVVVAPMRYGRLLLAGDAAHIVPPTGAKGMNLALADVRLLAPALLASLRDGDERLLDSYSNESLRRVWRAEEFSTYMTQMLHPHPSDEFENGVQSARLRQVIDSDDTARALARNYVNLSSL
ncbi:MAG: 4-hydroxybenzoate 3-monooxygenase [Acidimicrobiales bacterium]